MFSYGNHDFLVADVCLLSIRESSGLSEKRSAQYVLEKDYWKKYAREAIVRRDFAFLLNRSNSRPSRNVPGRVKQSARPSYYCDYSRVIL